MRENAQFSPKKLFCSIDSARNNTLAKVNKMESFWPTKIHAACWTTKQIDGECLRGIVDSWLSYARYYCRRSAAFLRVRNLWHTVTVGSCHRFVKNRINFIWENLDPSFWNPCSFCHGLQICAAAQCVAKLFARWIAKIKSQENKKKSAKHLDRSSESSEVKKQRRQRFLTK